MRTTWTLALLLLWAWTGTGAGTEARTGAETEAGTGAETEAGTGAETGTKRHDQVLSITVATAEQAELLRNITEQSETALWQPESSDYIKENVTVRLFVKGSGAVKELLQKHGLAHEVMLEDVQKLVKMQRTRRFGIQRSSVEFYESYHPLEEIYLWINNTAEDHPSTVEVLLLGSSFEKRPIYTLKLSLSSSPGKKALWVDCGIHAREWISPAFCLWFVQHSLESYGKDEEITKIYDHFDVYVLPVLNPDGYNFSWTDDRMWRKNRAVSPNSTCVGVDLNRNFDANWCTEGASPLPCRETYCGSAVESEPETQAVTNFLRTHKDEIQVYFSIHSFSQMILFPYSYSMEEVPNHNELMEMAQEAARKIKAVHGNNYTFGAGATTIYLAPGGSDDWAYDLGIKYSYTFELQDEGHYGFLLPPSHIAKACNEALLALKTIMLKVIENTRQDQNKTATEAGQDQAGKGHPHHGDNHPGQGQGHHGHSHNGHGHHGHGHHGHGHHGHGHHGHGHHGHGHHGHGHHGHGHHGGGHGHQKD